MLNSVVDTFNLLVDCRKEIIMRSNLQEKLTDRFLFLPKYLEIEDGWYDLIFNLCEQIEMRLRNKKHDFEVVQVKQKYGSLSFYTNIYEDNNLYNNLIELIDEFENKSENVCEYCGKKGKPIWKNHWCNTRCDIC